MARILEHYCLTLLRDAGIAVPAFITGTSPAAVHDAVRDVGGSAVIKALVPAGGRGKAGGVRFVRSPDEGTHVARELLGATIQHFPVQELLVSAAVPIESELFVAITFDSQSRRPVVLCSATGGIDIESIVARDPGALVQRTVDPTTGLNESDARDIAASAGVEGAAVEALAVTLVRAYNLFAQLDALTVEINPLARIADGTFVAASGVIVTDDLAAFRHPELAEMADPDLTNGWRPLTMLERQIRAIDRADPDSPIRFNEFPDGDVAFMAMGGGAGFFALDTILDLGGKPATTFDITPGRFEAKLRAAVGVIAARPGLRGFFAGGNISNFMPIDMRVRAIVEGLRDAAVDPARTPVVFRFDGPCIEEAKTIAGTLPGIHFYDAATTLDDAVARIVELTAARP